MERLDRRFSDLLFKIHSRIRQKLNVLLVPNATNSGADIYLSGFPKKSTFYIINALASEAFLMPQKIFVSDVKDLPQSEEIEEHLNWTFSHEESSTLNDKASYLFEYSQYFRSDYLNSLICFSYFRRIHEWDKLAYLWSSSSNSAIFFRTLCDAMDINRGEEARDWAEILKCDATLFFKELVTDKVNGVDDLRHFVTSYKKSLQYLCNRLTCTEVYYLAKKFFLFDREPPREVILYSRKEPCPWCSYKLKLAADRLRRTNPSFSLNIFFLREGVPLPADGTSKLCFSYKAF